MDLKAETIDADLDNQGLLMAEGWRGYACTSCSCYHIELLDKKEQPFANLAIDPDDLVPLARTLMEMAARMAEKGEIELPRLQ